MEEADKIQDALYNSCLQWIELYRLGSSVEEKRKLSTHIIEIWAVRAKEERKNGNYDFPNLKDYIPPEHWRKQNMTNDKFFLRFLGALTSYIERRRDRRYL